MGGGGGGGYIQETIPTPLHHTLPLPLQDCACRGKGVVAVRPERITQVCLILQGSTSTACQYTHYLWWK